SYARVRQRTSDARDCRTGRARVTRCIRPRHLLTFGDDDGTVVVGRAGPAMGDSEEPMNMPAWAEHVLSIAAERFERRLAEEIAKLRVDLTREMHTGLAEMIKWSFVFWIGRFAATAA